MKYATHFVAAYLGAGLSNGFILSQAIPAMNWFGIFTYAAKGRSCRCCWRCRHEKVG